jgi:predicted acyltransferase (DUF342 family)
LQEIRTNESWYIEQNQEMWASERIKIDGELIVEGSLKVGQTNKPDPTLPVYPDNFSYEKININQTVTIPENQQMIVSGFVKNEGDLVVSENASLVILGEYVDDDVQEEVPQYILINKNFEIKENYQKYYKDFLSIAGTLKINGSLAIGA